ncbi:MAG: cysteine hydrolase [Armatimonadetes bacterium]|nr:cysteine hydrolase [Armatimonadota bacterium]
MDTNVHNPFRQVLGEMPPPRLVGDRTALVVVDMQYFDAHPDWGEGLTARRLGVAAAFTDLFAQVEATIPYIQSLLAVCREKGLEVIHLRVAEVTDDSRDVGWKQVVRGLVVPKNSKEAELLEEVAPAGDEIVISKSSSGAFPTTNIDRILRNLGIETLIFTGTATGGCVESTVCDALDLGYDVIVVSDANVCSTPRSHRVALERMAARGAHVRSTAEMRDALGALARVDREAKSGVRRAEQYILSLAPTKSWERSPYELIFGPAIGVPLSAERGALIIVDAQRLTCDPDVGLGRMARERAAVSVTAEEFSASQGGGTSHAAAALEPYYARVRRALATIRRLADAARAAGMLVVHVRTAARTPDGRDLSRRLRARGVLPVRGSRETEIMPEVAPAPEDVVVDKPGGGVCTGTGLDELLRNAGIETVIMTGMSFDGAVEQSIRSLTDRSYGLILVPEACAAYDERLQEGFWKMGTGIINVIAAEEMVKRIASLRAPAAAERG